MLEEVLSLEGHRSRTFEDGASAIADFRERPADLVITDLGMPEVTGWQVAKLIRDVSSETPIVFITAVGEYVDPELVKSLGISAVLRKPFRLARIREILQEIA